MDEDTTPWTRKSCPDLAGSFYGVVRELSDQSFAGDTDLTSPKKKKEDSLGHSSFPGWLEDHIEMVGSPRPLRYTMRADLCSENVREDAIRQVAFMADRYKAQLEGKKQENVRRALSAPDLSGLLAEKAWMSARSPSSPSACPSCCAPLQKLQDLIRSKDGSSKSPLAYPKGSPFDSPENSVIIFDWDDTLLPTTFILQTILPSLPEQDRGGALPKNSPYYNELAAHAHVVEFVLRAARRVARVALVTNSMNPWVFASADRYLPGLRMEALLRQLHIPVYYARRHIEALSKTLTVHEEHFEIQIDHSTNAKIGMDIVPSDTAIRIAKVNDNGLVGQWNAENPQTQVLPGDLIVEVNGRAEDLTRECRKKQVLNIKIKREVPDRDPYMEAKRIDMDTCMQLFYPKGGCRRNVLSIGDSVAEQMAVKEVLPRTGKPATDSLCKTVALLLRPTIHQLSNELKILLVWLSEMMKYDKDFDLAMDRLDKLEKELFGMP